MSRTTAGESALNRSSSVMAVGTVASRATGFLRVAVVAAALGVPSQVADAYNVANVVPNIVYELLLGGVLTSVIVPLLVKSARNDADEGTGFAQLLLTIVGVVLGTATVAGVLAAPWIISIYNNQAGPQRDLEVTFLRYFLPQILFYGLGAAISAVLNTRGRFGAPMFTPVLNNIVVIGTALVFMTLPSAEPLTPAGLTQAQTLTLAIGTTLGVAVMTLALLPSLRAVGFRWRPRLDWHHPLLAEALRLGGWVLLYVVLNQIGYAVVVRLAHGETFLTPYANAFQLFQLPHAIITVSVISALLPRLSRHAVDQRLDLLRADLTRGLRLSQAFVIPAAATLFVLAGNIAVVVFEHGRTERGGALLVGRVLTGFAVGLPFFSAFQLQLRAFYAMHDSRTPALVNAVVNAVMIAVDLVLFATLDGDSRAVGLALGYSSSYVVGVAVFTVLLRRRLGPGSGEPVVRTLVRVSLASLLAAAGAAVCAIASRAVLGESVTATLVSLVLAVATAGALYVVIANRLRVAELADLVAVLRRRAT